MEQRRLRLGDILDDYCPRERRVTNHAIVAMVDEDVKQTRCTTCDAEHAYKGGAAPRRRRKDPTSALYKEVLAGMPDTEVHAPVPAPVQPVVVGAHEESANGAGLGAVDPVDDDTTEVEPEPDHEPERAEAADEGPLHRRLIRATLPRPEGQKDVRQAPEFTMRPNGTRPGGPFRGDRARGHGGPGGNVRGARRFGGHHAGGGGRSNRNAGQPGRNRQGFGAGSGRGPSGGGRPQGGRKRSR